MPKIKTHRGAAKRFKVTKSGKVKFSHSGRRHILTKKVTKLKRGKRGSAYLAKADGETIKKLLPYA